MYILYSVPCFTRVFFCNLMSFQFPWIFCRILPIPSPLQSKTCPLYVKHLLSSCLINYPSQGEHENIVKSQVKHSNMGTQCNA